MKSKIFYALLISGATLLSGSLSAQSTTSPSGGSQNGTNSTRPQNTPSNTQPGNNNNSNNRNNGNPTPRSGNGNSNTNNNKYPKSTNHNHTTTPNSTNGTNNTGTQNNGNTPK